MLLQAFCIISSLYVNSNWSYGPETAKWGHDLCDLDLWPLTLTFCMYITSVIGNYSWKFHDDMTTGTLSTRCHRQTRQTRQTDRQTEIAVLRAAWSQLKTPYNSFGHFLAQSGNASLSQFPSTLFRMHLQCRICEIFHSKCQNMHSGDEPTTQIGNMLQGNSNYRKYRAFKRTYIMH